MKQTNNFFSNWRWFQEPFDDIINHIHTGDINRGRLLVKEWIVLIGNKHPEVTIMLGSFCLAVFDNVPSSDRDRCIDFVFSLPEIAPGVFDTELFDCLSGLEWMAYQKLGVTPTFAGGFPTEEPNLLIMGLMCYMAGIFWTFDIPHSMKPSEMLVAIVEDNAKRAALNNIL